jgi:hypothetical protein
MCSAGEARRGEAWRDDIEDDAETDASSTRGRSEAEAEPK